MKIKKIFAIIVGLFLILMITLFLTLSILYIKALKDSIVLLVVGIIPTAIFAISLFMIFEKYITTPVQNIISTIHKIDEGDINARISYKENNEFGLMANAINDLINSIVVNEQVLLQSYNDLHTLTSNIPGGVCKCRLDEGYSFLFVSDGYLKIIGAKDDEFFYSYKNKFINTVFEPDRGFVCDEIKRQIEYDNAIEIEFRMTHSDKMIIWVLGKGKKSTNEDGVSCLDCVFIDITSTKEIQKELQLSEERHRIVLNQSEDIVFEWNFENNTMYYSPNWYRKFGYEPMTQNIIENIGICDYIHSEDKEAVVQLMKKASTQAKFSQTEARIAKDKKYIWCRIRITTIYDENKKPYKAVGIIVDIDEEKKKLELLISKTQTDPLSGLFNRVTFEKKAKEQMELAKKSREPIALLFIDIDNFKNINTNYGHPFGDRVISFIGGVLISVVGNIGFSGRLGGDEFLVCVTEAKANENIDIVAKNIISKLNEGIKMRERNANMPINCSIGVVRYDGGNRSYAELIKIADKAMYKVKNENKGNYTILESK